MGDDKKASESKEESKIEAERSEVKDEGPTQRKGAKKGKKQKWCLRESFWIIFINLNLIEFKS